MPDLYLLIVLLLFALAITDLVVGVSNDAVNFLNSAIGSRVAPRRTIMIVASLGIFVGATFSSGMMEVARKGIFNPEYYYFFDIMVLFLAVMLTDIILLDLFNTFGMPTSTTVSIVFELLGASFFLALIKVSQAGEGLAAAGAYINTSSALTIILGIFLSVGIAFTIGALVQYFSRLLFSFQYEKNLRWTGSVWAGLAMAVMTYFLLIKGMKGASFLPATLVAWTQTHSWTLIGLTFVGWTLIFTLVQRFFRINILRAVVLFGTFSLAMAFAGNDLVNFIGVPIAGFESYNAWSASGEPAETYAMGALSRAIPTKTYLLVLAGLIMIVTLWFSKKARSVTETEVNLGRQREGLERFSPNWLARKIVQQMYRLSNGSGRILPDHWLEKAEEQFEPADLTNTASAPAFDLVRASVNLTVASALIALATSYKLPLSTTYVSFMVAMGASLSDRAWGRDSAVYRVSGVINVIGGWFATALIAFTVSGVFAFLMYHFRGWAIGGIVLLAATSIYRSFALHRRREKKKERREAFQSGQDSLEAETLIQQTAGKSSSALDLVRRAMLDALQGLVEEDLPRVRKAGRQLKKLREENEEFKYAFYHQIKRTREQTTEASRAYLLVYDLEQDLLQSAEFIVDQCRNHLRNSHAPLHPPQVAQLEALRGSLEDYLSALIRIIDHREFEQLEAQLETKARLFQQVERDMAEQVTGIKQQSYNAVNSFLYFSVLLELKDLIAISARFAKLYARLHDSGKSEASLIGKNN